MKRAGHRLICFLLSFMLMISPAGNLSLEGGISSAFRTYAAEHSAASDGENSISDSGSGSEAGGSGSESGGSGSISDVETGEGTGNGDGSGSGTGTGEGTEIRSDAIFHSNSEHGTTTRCGTSSIVSVPVNTAVL